MPTNKRTLSVSSGMGFTLRTCLGGGPKASRSLRPRTPSRRALSSRPLSPRANTFVWGCERKMYFCLDSAIGTRGGTKNGGRRRFLSSSQLPMCVRRSATTRRLHARARERNAHFFVEQIKERLPVFCLDEKNYSYYSTKTKKTTTTKKKKMRRACDEMKCVMCVWNKTDASYYRLSISSA